MVDVCWFPQVMYNAMMVAYLTAEMWDKVESMVWELQSAGHVPNGATLSMLMSAFLNSGQWEKLTGVVNTCLAGGVSLNPKIVSRLITALKRQGRTVDAEEIFGRVQIDGGKDNLVFTSLCLANPRLTPIHAIDLSQFFHIFFSMY